MNLLINTIFAVSITLITQLVWAYGEAVSERVPTRSINPFTYVTPILLNPLVVEILPLIEVTAQSPLIGKSNTQLEHDIYGYPRGTPSDIGLVLFIE